MKKYLLLLFLVGFAVAGIASAGKIGGIYVNQGGTGNLTVNYGSLLVGSTTNQSLVEVATGSQGSLLMMDNNFPAWTATSTLGLQASLAFPLTAAQGGTNTTTAMTAGSVLFADASGYSQDNSNLFWDDTNKRLGIGTTSPQALLNLRGSGPSIKLTDTDSPYLTIGLASEVGGQLIDYGTNFSQMGQSTFNAASPTGLFRIDTRTGYEDQLFTVLYGAAGGGGTGTVRFKVGTAGQVWTGSTVTAAGFTTGLSTGLGDTGGLGMFVPQTSAAGHFSTDAAAGDMVIRSKSGKKLLIQNAYGASGLVLSSNLIGVNTVSPTKDLSFGGNVARTIWLERHTTAGTAGNNLYLQGGGATAAATDKRGGAIVFSDGISTGTSTGISFQWNTYNASSTSGTFDQPTSTKMTMLSSGFLGLGTITPLSILHVNTTATSTMTIDSQSATQGSCLKLKDRDGGGFTYCTTLDGTLSCSTTSCE